MKIKEVTKSLLGSGAVVMACSFLSAKNCGGGGGSPITAAGGTGGKVDAGVTMISDAAAAEDSAGAGGAGNAPVTADPPHRVMAACDVAGPGILEMPGDTEHSLYAIASFPGYTKEQLAAHVFYLNASGPKGDGFPAALLDYVGYSLAPFVKDESAAVECGRHTDETGDTTYSYGANVTFYYVP